MAKQLNVNLGVTADTSQAKAELAELQQSLQAITKMPAQSNLFSDVQLKQASKAAQELEMHLSKAVNVNTGKLDLARFSASIKSSEKDLTSYMNKLMAIGPQGQKTFLQLAKSIASAEAPTLRANQKLQQLGTTLKNTARWQISSSILHGFMGSIQSAYSYAQKLDKSLTDIRIVTGQSSDEMAKFAVQANKSAKALSSTTTAYTDAALIYYQQGLGDKAVKERTDATIKMSNVTGEAVKDVSSYMTAIWNNFNKQGDQTVEHFGDIMTKLGAETAASTAEIADGLSKFSAVADTIGLSFEMASSTVTAIVDQTREAPEVVGTALKTIFSRVEGLSLGETLEDGTDLNKYSKGLAKVGVDIKTATGELKDMDAILHEIGDVWETLNRDQQVALAQTVAGVRQYNQFTALFDNWGSVEENLSRAATAGGTLDEQAQIYAESWEAAQKRVKAAAENIWDSLLDDKFFIGILNGVEKVLEGVGGLVDGLGGLKGAFLLIGSIFMRHFAQSMPRVLENLRLNIMTLTGQAEKEANKVQQKTKDRLTAFQSNTNVDQASKIEAQGIQKVIEMKEKLAKHQKTMTDSQKAEYQARIDNVESLYKEAAAIQRKVQEMEEELQAQKTLAGQNINEKMQKFNAAQEKKSALESKLKAHNDGTKVMSDAELKATQAALEKVNIECVELDAELDSVKSKIIGVDGEMKKLTPEEIEKVNAEVGEQVGKFSQVFTKYNTLQQLIKTIGDQSAAWEKLSQETDEHGEILKEVKQDAQNFVTVIKSMAKEAGVSGKVLDTQFEKLEGTLNDEKATVLSIAQAFDTFLGNVTSDSGKFTKAIQGMDQYLDNLRQSLYDLGMTDEQLKPLELRLEAIAKKKAEASRNQNMGAGKSAEDPIAKPAKSQAVTEYASAIMGLQSTITSVTSCIKVFEDESSSAMEKFGAVLAVVTSAMFAFQGIVQLTNIATELGIFAHISSAAAKASEAGATGLLSAANLGLLATMPPILVVTLALVASLVALAAIVWAVTAAIKAFQASTPEGKLKAAQEEARALGDELNRVKEEAQALEDSFSNYDSITEKLDSCVKGTEEWKDALRDANNEVVNLMQQYPELATMVNEQGEEAITRNADGQLEIADWAREELEAKSDAKVAAAQGAYNRGQQNVRAAKVEVDRSNIADELYSDAGGRSFGEQIAGAILNPVGSIISTISDANKSQVSNVIAANAEKLSGLSGSELKTELREIFNKNGIIASVDKWAGYITEMGGDFTALTAAVEANTAAMEVENQNTAEEILSDSALNNSENGRMAMGAAGEAYSQIEQEAYDKYMQTDMANFGVGTSAGKDMFEQYASQMGLDSKDGFKVTDYTKDSVKYEYIDENGQKQEAEATKEMIASTLAAADAAGQLEDAMIALQKQIGKLKETGDEGDSATAKFLSEGNLEGTTKAEFDDLRSDVGFEKDKDGNISYDQKALDEKLGLSGKTWDEQQEIAKNAGYESAEAYRQAFVESMDVDFEVPKELTDAGIITDQMSMGASKKISETYENMGKEGGDAFLGAIDMVTKNADFQNLSPEDQTAAWNELANIDWTSWEAGDEAAKIMRNYGVEIDVTDEKWRQFINTMRDSQDALPDMGKFREEMEKINSITDEIDLGSIISAEDLQTLTDYNSELGKYFTILSDGSARFTGDLLDFQQEVDETHKTKLRENNKAYTDQIKEDTDKLNRGSIYDLDSLQGYATKGNEDGNGVGVGNRGGAGDDGVYSEATNDKLAGQLAFLESQDYDAEQVKSWTELMENGDLDPKHIREIGDAVKETTADYEGLGEQIKANQEISQGGMNELALMAEDHEERKEMYENGDINEDALNYAAMAAHNEEKWEGMDPEEVENYADALQEAAEDSELLSEELIDNAEAAEDVALYTKKMNQGVEKLSENYDDWSDVLKKSDKSSEEYCDAMDGMKDAMSDVLGVSEDFLSDDFIIENMEDIAKAAEGDAEAIDRLAIAAGKDILVNLEYEDNGVKEEVLAMHDELAAMIPDIKVGATVEDGDFLSKAAQIVETAGMTADQANAYFRSMGFEANFETKQQEVKSKKPIVETYTQDAGTEYKEYTYTGPDGEEHTSKVPFVKTRQYSKTVGYVEDTEMIEVPALTTGDGKPNFTLTRTNAGSMNNSSSSNRGGGGKGGGGGGGGGGSKKKDKKKKKDEIERYHEVKNSLEDLSKAFDKVSKAKDRAWGKDKMKLIQEEIDLLDKEIEKQEQYLDEIDGNYTKDKNALSKYGVKFDKDGNISNYDEVMTKQINKFNNGDRDDAAEDAYNDFKEAIEQYEETHDLWLDEQAAYQDMLDEKYDKLTELATAEFEITMEIDAQTQDYLDWLIGQSEDDIFQAADRIASISLSSQSTANANNSENGGEELIRDILENDNHNLSQKTIEGFLNNEDWAVNKVSKETFTADEIAQLEEGAAAMREAAAKLREDETAIHEELRNIISETTDQMDRQIDIIDTLTDMIQTYVDIVDVVGKKVLKMSNSDIKNLERSSLEGSRAALRSSKEEYETLKTERESLYAEYAKIEATLDETSKAKWKETLQEADDAMLEAQSNYTSRWQETLEKAAEIFENEVTRTLEEFSTTMTGAFKGSLEELQEAFDQEQEISQLYVQDYKKIYELSKLTRDISTSIDKTDNLEATRELADLQKTIAEYEEAGVQMSQYEIDHLRKKYELKLAEIALEESQNAKSQVRMQRDSEGNYGYVYTANEEDVAAAEQSYEDKLYEMQELNGEYINELQSNILQLQQDLAEELANVNRADFENTEEYTAKLEEIKARYYEKMGFYTSQMNTALDNQSDVYENDWTKYSEATGYKISANEDFVDSWDETTLAVLTGFENIEDYAKTFYDSLDTTLGDLSGAFDQWYQDVDGIMEDAGSSIETFGEDVEKTVGDSKNGLIKDINDAENAVSELKTAFEQLMQNSGEKATGWYNSWNTKMQELAEQAGLTSQAIIRLLETGKEDDDKPDKDDDDDKPATTPTTPTTTPTTKSFKVGGKFKVGKNTSIYDYAGDTSGEHQYYYYDPVYKLLGTKKINGKTWLKGRYHKLSSGVSGWFKKSQATALDTGGYTGDWGTREGKWALLHQKEIVLNAEDTANFLKAVDIVRDIASKIDLNAGIAQNGIGAMAAAGIKDHNQTLEQQVSIQANFPNATNHSEIEQAFENLVNMASQYANRK